jgi:tRNA threonylcarbamoyl adenosine modification protein (Sua5/YciO/YrdC/YwlC family)
MAAQLLKIHPDNPPVQRIQEVVDVLRSGGLVIYPTDTIYGIGCDVHNARAVERLAKLKGIKPEKANFSFICADLAHIADYARQITTPQYKVLKKALPGPFTFIFEANTNAPRYGGIKRKTVGIRVPDHRICCELVKGLGNPIVTTSIRDEDEVVEYSTDPELIFEKYEHLVDLVIDGGFGHNIASTVIDCQQDAFTVIRQGAGDISLYL